MVVPAFLVFSFYVLVIEDLLEIVAMLRLVLECLYAVTMEAVPRERQYVSAKRDFTEMTVQVSYRPVVPGCAGCAMAHPDFGISVNPISTRGGRVCPPNYYWHTRVFRPSDGPVS